jgi:adenosylhomocysteine nucleosidase
MTELAFDDPCILFALRRESAPFLRGDFRPHQRFPGCPCWARFCGPVWLPVFVVETGVGTASAAKALDWLLQGPKLGEVPYRPKLVLSAGFAGSLTEQRRVGDVILATAVVDGEGGSWPVTWPEQLPPGEWRPPLHRGRLLTVPRLVGTAGEKRELGAKHEAVAVDMESAVIARRCAKAGVPFGCLRVISDDVQTSLSPKLLALLAGGRVSVWRLLAALLGSPGMVGELWRLARDTRFAAGRLAVALGEVLTVTLPWTGDEG